MKRVTLFTASIASLTLATPLFAQIEVGVPPAQIDQTIRYLASDKLKGRESGGKENEEAARFIAAAFHKAGLRPIGTNHQTDSKAPLDGSGYFQPFTFPYGVSRGKDNRLQITGRDKTKRYAVGSEFAPHPLSGNGKVTGDIVFVGYGLQTREPARDDYAGVDVKGKIVLVLPGGPTGAPASVDIAGKAALARSKGASAVLVLLSDSLTDAVQASSDVTSADAGIPVLLLRRDIGEEILKAAGKSLDTVKTALNSAAQSYETGQHATLSTEVIRQERVSANIAGVIEGSDPVLKNEYIIIGAHMDHLGMGGSHSLATDRKPAIHHGADDNASGTAGVVALAEYLHQSPLKRSILLICFSGEELGLLGSSHYVRNPLVPLEKTVAMLNMDMIGRLRDNKVLVIGEGSSPIWGNILDTQNVNSKFTLGKNEGTFGGSDHQPFYNAKIPILFFFTGLHTDYHRPTDTADKINVTETARIVEFVGKVARATSDLPERPSFVAISGTGDAPRPRARVSLGTIPEYGSNVVGVLVGGTRPGSPAEKAGIKAGDIMVKFGERTIRNIEEFTAALGDSKPGDIVAIVVKRGDALVTVTVTLVESKRPQ